MQKQEHDIIGTCLLKFTWHPLLLVMEALFEINQEAILDFTWERVKITMFAILEYIHTKISKNQRYLEYISQYIGFLSFDYINHFIVCSSMPIKYA